MGTSSAKTRYPTRTLSNTSVVWCNAESCLKFVLQMFDLLLLITEDVYGMSERHEWVIGFSHILKIEFTDASPVLYCTITDESSKRFEYEIGSINRAPPSHSFQLPPNFRMVYNNSDYSTTDHIKMDYNSQHVCHLCDIPFNRQDALKRHMESKHGRDTKQGHICVECGKGFSRKDALKKHQLTCQTIRFKCGMLKDIASLTWHMGLCTVPTCATCQEQFVELHQLKEHQKSHRKRKATSDPLAHKLKKRKSEGWFHCRICLFASREELFHHRLDHMDDSRAYRPVEPHFDFEDEKLNTLLRDNAQLIYSHHRFSPVSADFNFPLTLPLERDGRQSPVWWAPIFLELFDWNNPI